MLPPLESCREESPVRVQEQGLTRGAKRAITVLMILLLGIGAGVFFGRFYFVQEFLLFVCIAALLAFFTANLVVLGILFQAAERSAVQAVRDRRMKRVAARAEASAGRQPRPFLGSPAAGTSAAGSIKPSSVTTTSGFRCHEANLREGQFYTVLGVDGKMSSFLPKLNSQRERSAVGSSHRLIHM